MARGSAVRAAIGALTVLAVAAAACTSAPAERLASSRGGALVTTTTSTAAAPEPTTTTAAPAPTTAAAPPAPTTTAVRLRPRLVTEQAWTPFANVGGVVLQHPSRRVERVGFHESNHDGARQLEALPTAVQPTTLESRERGTGSQTAADIVVDPAVEIRSPVTGRVKRGGSYVLYCENRDFYVVIEPDAHPGWEVKVLHMTSMNVTAGQRVVAGETVLADGPRQLPFESQVDELRPGDAWPHVHLEVVDPSIPDRPSPGGGCP